MINIVVFVIANVLWKSGLASPLLCVAVIFAVVATVSCGANQRIAAGNEWGNGAAVLASLLVGLNSALCCGILGMVVMQQIAAAEMKRYGLKPGFLGLKKSTVQAAIA